MGLGWKSLGYMEEAGKEMEEAGKEGGREWEGESG